MMSAPRRGHNRDRDERKDEAMKLTTITHVSVDGVMQGLGGPDEDRRGGFERGGWALPLFNDEAATFLNEVFQRADAFLFGRRTYEIFAGYSTTTWSTRSPCSCIPWSLARARGSFPTPAQTQPSSSSTRGPPPAG